jgi:MFS family permease
VLDAQRKFETTLRLYFIHVFSYDFIFGYAIFPAFFQLQGEPPELVGAILATWAAGIIVFEIPAGLLADKWDRRVLLALSPLLKAACFLTWILADGRIALYFVGILLWSVASALRTGTKEALLYDHVIAASQAHRYTTILGRERGLQETATLLGAALGGFVASHNPELAFWTSLAPLALCAWAACFILDVRSGVRAIVDAPRARVTDLLRTTWNDCVSKPEIRHVTLYLALCITFFSTLEDFNQLFLLALDAPIWSLGLIIASIGVARAVLVNFASWFEQFSAYNWLAPLASGAALMASGFLPAGLAGLSMALSFCLIAPLLVLTTGRMQRALDGSSRATTTSVISALMEFLSLVFNLTIALLFAHLDVVKTYQAAGAYLVLFAMWELFRGRAQAARTTPPAP